MATLTKRGKNFGKGQELARLQLLQERDSESINLEAFKGAMSYLKYLYAKGEMSDKTYETLIAQVLSIFVENSIRLKVERMLIEVDAIYSEANTTLLRNILA